MYAAAISAPVPKRICLAQCIILPNGARQDKLEILSTFAARAHLAEGGHFQLPGVRRKGVRMIPLRTNKMVHMQAKSIQRHTLVS